MADFDGQVSHEGHDHPPMPILDEELFEKLMKDVMEAKVIDNLFLIPMGGSSPRFVMAQVAEDGVISTLGYIPLDFMLDVSIGFIAAMRNAMKVGMVNNDPPPEGEEGEEERPLIGGLFKVI